MSDFSFKQITFSYPLDKFLKIDRVREREGGGGWEGAVRKKKSWGGGWGRKWVSDLETKIEWEWDFKKRQRRIKEREKMKENRNESREPAKNKKKVISFQLALIRVCESGH